MEINGTIFVQIIIFMSLLLWLSRSLFAPILRLFEERERQIDGAKEEAMHASKLAEEKAEAFNVEYEKARDDARQMLSKMKSETNQEHATFIEGVKSKSKETIEKAELELKQEINRVRPELMSASQTIADEIVSALLARKS